MGDVEEGAQEFPGEAAPAAPKNNVHNDPKHLEEMCFLKIVYDLFPSGTYNVSDLYRGVKKNAESILKWRSSFFEGAERMWPEHLSDYLFNEKTKCFKTGMISYLGKTATSLNKVEKPIEEVLAVLNDPWRSLDTDFSKFSRGEAVYGMGISYYRDVVIQAKRSHGRSETSLEGFFDMPNISEYSVNQSAAINVLYNMGFLEVSGRLMASMSSSPTFAPFRVRLKGSVFDPEVSAAIEDSGYTSKKWDGKLPSMYEDVQTLRDMLVAQPFLSSEIDAGKLFRRGYLERTSDHLRPNPERGPGCEVVYRVRKGVAELLHG